MFDHTKPQLLGESSERPEMRCACSLTEQSSYSSGTSHRRKPKTYCLDTKINFHGKVGRNGIPGIFFKTTVSPQNSILNDYQQKSRADFNENWA